MGVKRPGREVGHSPPSSAAVVNKWSYTFTASCATGKEFCERSERDIRY